MYPTLFTIPFIGLEIRFYGLMYAIAFFSGIQFGKVEAKRRGIDPNIVDDYGFLCMLSGIIGARIYYVIFRWSDYQDNILDIFAVWKGGLAIHGGVLGGIICTLIFAYVKKIDKWTLGDMAATPLIFGQTLGRFGNFMNGEIHGYPIFTPLKVIFKGNFGEWWNMYKMLPLIEKAKFKPLLPFGIVFPENSPAGSEFPGIAVHPAMLYELFLNLLAFISIWFFFRFKKIPKGYLFLIYIIEYSVIRSIVSMFRAEDLKFFGMRAPHAISVVLIGWALTMMILKWKKFKKVDKKVEVSSQKQS